MRNGRETEVSPAPWSGTDWFASPGIALARIASESDAIDQLLL